MVENQNIPQSSEEFPYSFSLDSELSEDVETLEGESHLRFFLPSGDEFALSAMGIREIMQQETGHITPIPNASPLLIGTINLRGEIIWVADLGQFLGYPQMLSTERGDVPVIAVEEQDIVLGLAVKSLGAIHWLEVDKLQIPQNIPDHIAPYVQGEWVEGNNHHIRVLDHIAILRSARWVA